ncbi:hypothetical protein [Actinomadura gamaensis]|uniref:Uncharacterized protein n=1 Tax=Actinomadura gamaensis TaxID=1763541 RepID=A0ABV9TZC8_9ACTN
MEPIEAIQLTPHGIPLIAYPVGLGLVALAAWDGQRGGSGTWYAWLEPLGVLVTLVGIFLLVIPLSVAGVLVSAIGLGITKYRRDKGL